MSKTTLQQVAGHAGVSKTTASLVLNGKADSVNIAQATRQRVIETAKSLNYKPGLFNPGKLNGQSGIIGVFASSFITSNNGRWLQYLIKFTEAKGYIILPRLATPQNVIQKINEVPFDAVIILQKELLKGEPEPGSLEFPIVCAGFIPDSASIKSIAPDFEKQTNELIHSLYRHNKKAIGLLCTKENSKEKQQKTKTYKENYCRRFDIMPNIEELTSSELTGKEIAGACIGLIEKGANGIIFETPEMATIGMREAKVRNMSNNGILFAAYDKIEGSELLPENLLIHTTPDIEEMARQVIAILIDNRTGAPGGG
jgi:DNA-binding LacI/PurR family transcriptional regulator